MLVALVVAMLVLGSGCGDDEVEVGDTTSTSEPTLTTGTVPARSPDVTGIVQLPEGTEMVMPGDNVTISVELITPVAMDKGLRFAIREGGRTVGAGTVSEVIE